MSGLADKHLLVVVSGGIAAYKTLEFVRRAREAGAQIEVVMTAAAQAFVGPLSFQALSGRRVHTDLLDESAEAAMGHIELARWADLVVVAPASADFIARLRAGLADDLASTLCLATTAPLLLAPAMNHRMWGHPATQENLRIVTERGARCVGPDAGDQACGENGPGRMAEPAAIIEAARIVFAPAALDGCRMLITAGPTQEAIDPVRYISNRSSGKMGYALARAAAARGATVTLVSGPVSLPRPGGMRIVDVVTAGEMYAAVMDAVDDADIFIASAAVADYSIAEPAVNKRKKDADSLRLTLCPTQDILAAVTARPNPPFAVGFAAETENLLDNARAKLQRKSLDMIAANDVGVAGIGFDSNDNELHVLWHGGGERLQKAPKDIIAERLTDLITARYTSTRGAASGH